MWKEWTIILGVVCSAPFPVLSQQTRPVLVKEDQVPLRSGCSETDSVVARLPAGKRVHVKFALSGGARCYAVSATAGGKTIHGYLRGDALSGLEEFDRARGAAPSVAVPGTAAASKAERSLGVPRPFIVLPDRVLLRPAGAPWEVSVAEAGWQVSGVKRQDNGPGWYWLLENKRLGVNLSAWFERADRCNTPADCRTLGWTEWVPNPAIRNPDRLRDFEVGEFAVRRFVVHDPLGLKGDQLGLSAHAVREGYWLNVHLSRFPASVSDEGDLVRVLKGLQFIATGR